MVYCGKPSRGCQNCKTRRIKCDEIRPHCSQCRKSSRDCPGYPDEFDLIFRNETSAVKRRAQRAFSTSAAKNNRSKRENSRTKSESKTSSPTEPALTWDTSAPSVSDSSPPSDSILDDDSLKFEAYQSSDVMTTSPISDNGSTLLQRSPQEAEPQKVNWPASIPWSLTMSGKSSATPFFFKNYVHCPKELDSMRGFIEVLPQVYDNSPQDSLLHRATNVVAMGALSNAVKSTSLRIEARNSYGRALTELRQVIEDQKQALSDDVLMSILLFSLYEQITWTPASAKSWTQHIDGAVTLVKLRGKQGVSTPVGLHLFRAVRALMLTSTIQKGSMIDEFPIPGGWSWDSGMDLNAANRLALISLELPDIKHRAQQLLAQEKTSAIVVEMMSLIDKARKTDAKLEQWQRTLPDVWKAETRKVVDEELKSVFTSEFWPGPVYVYHDLMIANVLNIFRTNRIFCQAVVLGCIAALPSNAQTEEINRRSTQATYVTRNAVNEICWSVPFMLGFDYHTRSRVSKEGEAYAKSTGAYFTAWPLLVCRKVPCVSTKQQYWALGRLYHIGRTFGTRESRLLGQQSSQSISYYQVEPLW